MGTDRGQLLMIGQVGALENGWYQGPVGSGRNGWGDGIRSHRGKEVDADPTLERERGRKVRFWLCKGWIMPKLDPFYPQTAAFLRICAAGWQIHVHIGAVNCKVKNILLYDCIDLCRLLAAKKDWSMVMCHTRTLAECDNSSTEWRTFGTTTTTECMQGSRSTSVAHWIG